MKPMIDGKGKDGSGVSAESASQWCPEGFGHYREWYPATPPLSLSGITDVTEDFCQQWNQGIGKVTEDLRRSAASTTLLFVRGFMGNFMPGNFEAPRKAFANLGFDSRIVPNSSRDSVHNNVQRLKHHLLQFPPRTNLVFCAHSRGGIECLQLLSESPIWDSRCRGLLLSQTARGPSLVLDSVLLGMHRHESLSHYRRSAEFMQKIGLKILGADRGGLELTSGGITELIGKIGFEKRSYPIVQTASWSTKPTAWLDSFHGRMSEIAPGIAHDGQFLLKDLLWPGWPHLLLPHLDHAQPVMGGNGFDSVRYWLTYVNGILK